MQGDEKQTNFAIVGCPYTELSGQATIDVKYGIRPFVRMQNWRCQSLDCSIVQRQSLRDESDLCLLYYLLWKYLRNVVHHCGASASFTWCLIFQRYSNSIFQAELSRPTTLNTDFFFIIKFLLMLVTYTCRSDGSSTRSLLRTASRHSDSTRKWIITSEYGYNLT